MYVSQMKVSLQLIIKSECLKQSSTKTFSLGYTHLSFSVFQEKDITPDPKLFEKVSECDRCLAITRHQEHPLAHLSPELSDVFDFFIALTICNTVVVTSPDQPRQKVGSGVSL